MEHAQERLRAALQICEPRNRKEALVVQNALLLAFFSGYAGTLPRSDAMRELLRESGLGLGMHMCVHAAEVVAHRGVSGCFGVCEGQPRCIACLFVKSCLPHTCRPLPGTGRNAGCTAAEAGAAPAAGARGACHIQLAAAPAANGQDGMGRQTGAWVGGSGLCCMPVCTTASSNGGLELFAPWPAQMMG